MHLSTVYSSRYYSAQPESGDMIQSAIQTLLRREELVNYHPSWTKTTIITVTVVAVGGVLALAAGIIHRRIKRRNASKGKQQQHWYVH
jgi:transketolase N-terminal domain/subunit